MKIFAIILILMIPFSLVSAHFFGGYTIQNIAGDYIYSVNFNAPRPYSGVPLTINLHLNKDNINNTIPFSNVQIKIKQFNREYLDRNVTFVEGDNTNTEFTFPGPGRYQVYLTYFQGDKQIVSPDFELIVFEPPRPGSKIVSNLVLWSPAFLLLLVFGFWIRSKNKKDTTN